MSAVGSAKNPAAAHIPGRLASDKQVIRRHVLVGGDFSEANTRVFSPVIERAPYSRHLIDS